MSAQNAIAYVEEICQILVAGIVKLGEGIGSGVQAFVTSLAFTGTGENQTLSIFFIMVLVFAGVALAIGLTRLVYMWLTSLGN